MSRFVYLLAAAGFLLPLPAYADCASRISTIEADLVANQPPEAGEADGASSESATRDGAVGNGSSIRDDGGTTEYQEEGPAMPQENWFGSEPKHADAMGYLEEARKAEAAGNESACLDAVQEAEAALQGGTD